jgi:hypothetical protein
MTYVLFIIITTFSNINGTKSVSHSITPGFRNQASCLAFKLKAEQELEKWIPDTPQWASHVIAFCIPKDD